MFFCLNATLRRGAMAFALVSLTGLLFACSSKYKWHDASDEDGRFTVSYPGEPRLDVQDVPVNGGNGTLRTQTVSIDDQVFAVGSLRLPAGHTTSDDQNAALDGLMQGLARNASGSPPSENITIEDRDGHKLPAKTWGSNGLVPGTKQGLNVSARFVAKGDRVYEVVIVGQHAPSDTIAQRFFDSFKPY